MSARRLLGRICRRRIRNVGRRWRGQCLARLTQFAIDVRLPLPATCPDCGADVLARADIEEPFPPGRLPFDALRIRRAKR